MKLRYMGKYSGNPDELPTRKHEFGSVKFKEPNDSTSLVIVASIIATITIIILEVAIGLRGGNLTINILECFLIAVAFILHEIIHALFFREDVYIYSFFKKGLLFVYGCERMSKNRFMIMNMMPNTVLGGIPFALYMINTEWNILGCLGVICITSGAIDYINVFNAIVQLPKGARVYMYKFSTYWYMLEIESEQNIEVSI